MHVEVGRGNKGQGRLEVIFFFLVQPMYFFLTIKWHEESHGSAWFLSQASKHWAPTFDPWSTSNFTNRKFLLSLPTKLVVFNKDTSGTIFCACLMIHILPVPVSTSKLNVSGRLHLRKKMPTFISGRGKKHPVWLEVWICEQLNYFKSSHWQQTLELGDWPALTFLGEVFYLWSPVSGNELSVIH